MDEFDSDTSFSISSLLCQEDESNLIKNEGKHFINLESSYSVTESDDEYIQILIEREMHYQSNGHGSRIDSADTSKHWLKCARLDAIEWILNTRARFGFHFRTAYLSLTYFDRFNSKRSIMNGKVWAIRLLSVACLSLAAKMEECEVPALSEYHVDDYDFESNVIKRMELLVLNTLEWKMSSITPFAYLHYFTYKFCGDSRPKDLISKPIELILSIARDIFLMDHRPSVIAAAAVLAAYRDQLTKNSVELKMSVISSWGSLEKEQIYSCYNLLQEMEMGISKTPNSLSLPYLFSTHISSGTVFEDSIFSSAVGTKRKLTFSDFDQECLSQKINRR